MEWFGSDFVNDFGKDFGNDSGMTLVWPIILFVLHKRIGPISMHSAIGNCIRDTLDSVIGQSSLPL